MGANVILNFTVHNGHTCGCIECLCVNYITYRFVDEWDKPIALGFQCLRISDNFAVSGNIQRYTGYQETNLSYSIGFK